MTDSKSRLERNDKKPFNIQNINGVWMFLPQVFGDAASSLPDKGLLLVPDNLIPKASYSDGKTGYVREDAILSYVQSQQFKDSYEHALQVTAPRNPRARRNINAIGYTNFVESSSKFLSGFDSEKRQNTFTSTVNRVNVKTGEKVAAKTKTGVPFEYDQADPWSYFTEAHKWGTSPTNNTGPLRGIISNQTVIQNGEVVIGLADDTGALSSYQNIDDFASKLYNLPTVRIRNLYKLMGKTPQDVMTAGFAAQLASIAAKATYDNWQMSVSSTARGTRKPWTLEEAIKAPTLGNGGSGSSKTRTDKTYNTLSIGDAANVLNQFMQEATGQRATDAQIKRFTDLANKKLAANPSVQVSTTTSSGTTTRNTASGFGSSDINLMAQKQAESTPGAVGYMGATKFMDALKQLISNPLG